MIDVQTVRTDALPRAELRGAELPLAQPTSLWDALITSSAPAAPWLVFHRDGAREVITRGDVIASALRWAHAIVTVSQKESPERIGVLLPNGPDFVGAFFAAQALGAAAVPLAWPVLEGDVTRLSSLLGPVVSRARLDALITTPAIGEAAWGVPVVTATARGQVGGVQPAGGQGAAFIQFTSGSTGAPRGAVISQRAALASARAMALALDLGPRDVGVSWLPFFHDMGLVGVLLTSLLAQFPVHVLRPGDFLLRPRRWLELVSKERATLTVGPDFAYQLLNRRVAADGLDLSSLRCVLDGSEPVHRATLDAFAAKFAPAGLDARALLPVYGLAEATLGVAFATREHTHRDLNVGGRLVPPVGTVVPGLALRVVGTHGEPLLEGEEGELCVRGASLMSGYFEDEAATRETMRDGWLRTGDLGVVRHGAVYVTGREKELVIQKGRKFHPYDIERAVAGLVDATPNGVAAVTRLDAATGAESLVVVVELRRQSSRIDPMVVRGEVLRELGAQVDAVEFVAAGELPRTTSGKVKRRELSQRMHREPVNTAAAHAARESPDGAPRTHGASPPGPAASDFARSAARTNASVLARPRVLVLGAGGFLGLNLTRALLAEGHTPRCGRRQRGNVLGLRELGVPLVVTNFDDATSLRAAMRQTDVVVHAAAHYPRFSTHLQRTIDRGLGELERVLDAAADAGVRRMLFISSTATIAPRPDGAPSSEDDTFSTRPTFGTYHALKWELEQRALAERRFELGVVNPSACLGPFDWKVGTSALLLAMARGVPPPHPDGRVSLVDARDVALALTRLVTSAEVPRRLILSGETWSVHALLAHVATRFQAPPPGPPLHADAARALADAQEAEAEKTNGRAALPRELVDLIINSPQLDVARTHALGFRFRPLSDTLDDWEAWALRMGLLRARDSITLPGDRT